MKDLIWKLQKKTVPLLLILWNCVTNLCSITRKKNQCFTEICFYCESYTDEHQKRWKKWQKQITTSLEKENILQKTREECSFLAPIKIILDWQIYKTLKKPPWKKKELYLMEKILLAIFTTKLPSGSTPKFRYSFSVETIDS